MQPTQVTSDRTRYQWDGQQWVALPPEGKPPSGRMIVVVVACVVVLSLVAALVAAAALGWLGGRTTSEEPPVATGSTSPGSSSSSSSSSTDATASTVPAVDPEAELADPSFFVQWLPDLRTAPAPDWVEQGTRITYYAAAASVPGSYHEYVEDENGGWVDPATGDRYRQDDIPGAAGHGYNQISVTELNQAVAALSIHVYGLTDLARTSPVTTLTWGGAVGLPGAGSDYWLNPDVLAGVDEVVTGSLKVVRMPYRIDGTEYSSLWIQSIGDDGNYTWVFDEDSGVLLHTASSTKGAPITGPVAEGEGREGSTFLTQSTLVDIRQPGFPWAEAAAPSWIGSIDHIEFEGSVSVGVGGSPTVLDASLAADRLASGTDWARYRFARTLHSTVAPDVTEYMERVDGSGQVAALWVPPDELAELSAGQELDRDPITQTTVSVAAVEPTDTGYLVTIRESGPAEESDLVYDGETGMLVSSTSVDLHIGVRSDYRITGWS